MENKSILPLQGRPLFIKISALLFLVLTSGMLIGSLGTYTASNLYGYSVSEMLTQLNTIEPGALRIVQAFYTLGFFFVPALIFVQLSTRNPYEFVGNKPLQGKTIIATLLLIVFGSFVVDAIVYITYHFPYPDFMANTVAGFLEQQEALKLVTNSLLQMDSSGELILNLLIMAVLPAFSEEWLFRGVIQKILKDHWLNEHRAIWFTAFMFATLHQSYFYFFGLFFLGALLGYVKEWTGNLWLCILLHFLNNGVLVVLAFYNPELLEEEGSISWLLTIVGILGTTALIYYLSKNRNQVSSAP